ncbi:hypothetical protein PYCCODRAFT_147854 [Trametes coccinea BRFM310]|uniref:Uncharacterized protein n=1 Tax=Trametes coccinea (strain BRFM310) TaxID=1353009 RepID=A0A1Y2IWL1_TRAC3|nr:hypothetical protein PYCCODRAFT_147854 [Trametes coccinea BRFM310]
MSRLFPQPCPELPDFQSLVVKGLYDASAPVHLLLSHITQHPDATVILLTPSREQFKESLVELNDEWISQNSGHGRVCAVAQRTEIFYPPTLAHLRLLLSMLHEYHGVVHHPKTTLASAPSMLVLHEISSYFNAPSSEATVAAYLSVISSALALTSSWSPQWFQSWWYSTRGLLI